MTEQDQTEQFNVRAAPPAARQFNRKVVTVVALAVVAIGLVVFQAIFENPQGRHSSPQQKDKQAAQEAAGPYGNDGLLNLPTDYSKVTRNPKPKIITIGNQENPDQIQNLDSAQRPNQADSQQPLTPLEQARIIAMEQAKAAENKQADTEQQLQQRELEMALASPILFPVSDAQAQLKTIKKKQRELDQAELLARALESQRDSPPNPNEIQPPNVRQNLQTEKVMFSSSGADREPYLQKPYLKPASPYVIQAGTVVPGHLITAINTDLPGECIAMVSRNVYDTPTGQYLLIPAGSKLYGEYSSLVSNGQNRAQIGWTRLIMPNGRSISLGKMTTTDEKGQGGLQDRVDYHWDRLTTAMAMSTGIAFAGNAARDQDNPNSERDFVGDTVAQEGARVGQQIIERELDVQPTITVRSGYPLRLLVNKDIVLEPYVQ